MVEGSLPIKCRLHHKYDTKQNRFKFKEKVFEIKT